jgi:hypothetical protein
MEALEVIGNSKSSDSTLEGAVTALTKMGRAASAHLVAVTALLGRNVSRVTPKVLKAIIALGAAPQHAAALVALNDNAAAGPPLIAIQVRKALELAITAAGHALAPFA